MTAHGKDLALRARMELTLASAIRKFSPLRRHFVLAADVSNLAEAPSRAVFTRIGEVEIDEALDLSEETEDERCLMQHRLNCGHWCVAGRIDGELAFYAWVMFGEMEIGARVVSVPDAYAYSYKVFTARRFRRQGLASAYFAFLKHELSKNERVLTSVSSNPYEVSRRPATRRHLLTTVASDNVASRGLHERCGFSSFGTVWTVRGTDRALTTNSVALLVERTTAARAAA